MTPYLADSDVTLYCGDALEVLAGLPDGSVNCVATSPPFYALRDYGTGTWEGGDPDCDHKGSVQRTMPPGSGKASNHGANEVRSGDCECGARRVDRQIGLEATPEEWVDRLVAVFRECRRVLRDDGVLWVECGDSYSSSPPGNVRGVGETSGLHGAATSEKYRETLIAGHGTKRDTSKLPGVKPKDLLGQPWMLAFALRADGWYLRDCIIWHRPNPMPESVRDRTTKAHSYVFLLSKKPRYWFDADSIAEPAAWERWGDQTTPKYEGTDTATGWIPARPKNHFRNGSAYVEQSSAPSNHDHQGDRGGTQIARDTKNARSVWTIPTQGYPGAHFATFPEELVRRMIVAGCPEWVCGTCGKPRTRLIETERELESGRRSHGLGESTLAVPRPGGNPVVGVTTLHHTVSRETVGWSDCGHGNYEPGTVLDPFGGSGTTGLVARKQGRRAILIELNPDYCSMAAERLSQLSLLA